jgi:hypothetical protein
MMTIGSNYYWDQNTPGKAAKRVGIDGIGAVAEPARRREYALIGGGIGQLEATSITGTKSMSSVIGITEDTSPNQRVTTGARSLLAPFFGYGARNAYRSPPRHSSMLVALWYSPTRHMMQAGEHHAEAIEHWPASWLTKAPDKEAVAYLLQGSYTSESWKGLSTDRQNRRRQTGSRKLGGKLEHAWFAFGRRLVTINCPITSAAPLAIAPEVASRLTRLRP